MSTSPAPAPGSSDASHLSEVVDKVAENVKPHLRGWIHLGVTPLVVIASIVLVVLSPTSQAKWSCAVFGLLKRVDEKWVTERAYDNPKFVEDLVRDIALRLMRDPRIGHFTLSS